MTSPRPRAVLLVEDESIVARDLQQCLRDLGYDVFGVAASAEEAMAQASERRPDIALVDIRIKGRLDGVKTAQLLQERFGVPIVYMTGHADDATLQRALRTRPHGISRQAHPDGRAPEHDRDRARGRSRTASVEAERLPSGFRSAPEREVRPPAARAVRRQLERLFGSGDFDAPRRSREFLRFVAEEAIAGRGDAITQSAIAIAVFGRRSDFDAIVDPIVRIQAGRLRRSLERYYLLSGKDDPVRIELPKGTYVPVFRSMARPEEESSPARSRPRGLPRAPPRSGLDEVGAAGHRRLRDRWRHVAGRGERGVDRAPPGRAGRRRQGCLQHLLGHVEDDVERSLVRSGPVQREGQDTCAGIVPPRSPRRSPCQTTSGRRRPGAGRPVRNRGWRRLGWRFGSAISSRTKRNTSWLASSRRQSNQDSSLSWQ